MKTDFRDLEDGGFYVYPLTLKFNSDGSLSYSAYIVNKNKKTMNFDWIRVEIYNYNGDLIAKQKFENRKESVDYGDFIKINLKIDKNNIYSTDVDLYNGYFDEQWTVNWY